jgi:hypothetical protein
MKAFYTFGLLVLGWGFSHLDAQDQEPLNHLGVLAKTHATLLTKFPVSCVTRSLCNQSRRKISAVRILTLMTDVVYLMGKASTHRVNVSGMVSRYSLL